MIGLVSHHRLAQHAAHRPSTYLLDLEPVIVQRDERGVWIDTDRPAYRELLRKYRSPAAPRPGDAKHHWQAWREEGGRWVPDGWLKPGHFADPPAFDPLPGERLSTPGFPAAEFAAPVSAEPVDVVIPLGTGSRHEDAELRYALRSIEKHVENLGRVWIVGYRPAWLQDAEHIPSGDPSRNKDANILAKIQRACIGGCSDRFVFWSDDQALLRPLAFSQLGPYCWGDLAGTPLNGQRWHRRLLATRDWLRGCALPTLHCDTHAPIPMERAKFLDLARRSVDAWTTGDGVTVGTWYCNQAAEPQPMGHRKATVEGALPSPEVRAAIAGRWFLGYNDAGFTPELRALLDELFPEPSRFELEPAIRVKPAGPTLSIIIPTIGRPTLRRTLESIHSQQLVDGDEVLVVQDGPSDLAVWAAVKASGLPARYLATGKRAADFGGTPRNHGMTEARGDYLAFMDDDDVYRPGAFDAIRAAATRHPGRPLMFRMERPGWGATLWREQRVAYGNVGTPMFVAPNRSDRLGAWGRYVASDLAFIATSLERWPPGALVWNSFCLAFVEGAAIPAPDQRPLVRNLIYHVYPRADNGEWRANVEEMLKRWDLFNGRKVVGIVTGPECDDCIDVQRAFSDSTIEWLVKPNDPTRGESVTFLPAAERLRSWNADEVTFYAHAKGTSDARQQPEILVKIRRWRRYMYRACLDGDADSRDGLLRRHACAGSLKHWGAYRQEHGRPPSLWHFSGTFFWFHHPRFYITPDALRLGSSRWALERHLGELFPPEEAVCLGGDHLEHTTNWSYRLTEDQWTRLEGDLSE